MKVFITGGTGYLGRGILRRFADSWDITVYSRDEYKQFQCHNRWPLVNYVLGDVTNYERLVNSMRGHDVVIHAAAVKFIPEAENNVNECIDVNVLGSRCVFEAAKAVGVKQVVAISTDKACEPINVYGMTKALVERMVGEYAKYNMGYTKYTSCRYGNVVGSTGSVIPLFQRQVAESGRVTITDPDMTRYWISIDDAVDLILAAMDQDLQSGSIIIPSPASMTIGDLAALFVQGDQSKIDIIGMRPGEKKHESLLHAQEAIRTSWSKGGQYILHPVGSKATSEPFVLSSETSKRLTPDGMMRSIADAVAV